MALTLGTVAAMAADIIAPEEISPTQVREALRPLTHVIAAPAGMAGIGDGQLVWVMGDPESWASSSIDALLAWVSRGNVCWFDVRLSQALGIAHSDGAAMDTAVVAEGAEEHALAAGVRSIVAPDAFAYMRRLPAGVRPVMVACNSPERAVMAVWEVGNGLVIFRPPAQYEVSKWPLIGKRGWIDPHRGDGARLLSNLELFTLEKLGQTVAAPPAE
jgi:rhodanese-related sulfurtransferase